MQSVRNVAIVGVLLGSAGLTTGLTGCTDLAGKPPLPSGIPDQQAVHTAAGARQAYAGAIVTFEYATLNGGPSLGAAASAVVDGGLLSDELMVNTAGGSPLDYLNDSFGRLQAQYDVDSRNLPQGGASDHSYSALQTLRARAAYALGMLAAYDSTEPALRGHLAALTGYAELYLADLFCSGVPLSTLDYNGDFTYKAGSPTDSVYLDAVRQFQRALPLLTDSVALLNLARVGLGRAWLSLGQYDSAAKAVAQVPTSYVYQLPVDWSVGWAPNSWLTGLLSSNGGGLVFPFSGFGATVADREGGVGQPYVSSDDPRTAVVQQGSNQFGVPLYFPAKYSTSQGVAPLTIASGIEARLIEAEAALHGVSVGQDWLTILNTLRTNGGSTAVPADTIADTLGITDCGSGCGTTESTAPSAGQPAGGFPVPQGYRLADSVIIHPVSPAISQSCFNDSWYLPCYGPDSTTTVYVYVKPAKTQYFAGTGGVNGLAPLNDPGSATTQVDLVFQERAFWLYLDGHRLGDLRRLIRRYSRPLLTVMAIGQYVVPVPQYPTYGSDVEFPIPATERQINPHFTGCLSRGS